MTMGCHKEYNLPVQPRLGFLNACTHVPYSLQPTMLHMEPTLIIQAALPWGSLVSCCFRCPAQLQSGLLPPAVNTSLATQHFLCRWHPCNPVGTWLLILGPANQ